MDSSPSPIPVISDIFEGGKRNFAKSFELSMKKANELYVTVARNVQTLKNGNAAAAFPPALVDVSDQPAPATMAEPSTARAGAAAEAEAPPGRANASALMLKTWGMGRVGDSRPWKPASASSISLSSSSSLGPSEPTSAQEEEVPSPHFDLSTVSATSVFDIGSVGSPLLGGPEICSGKSDLGDDIWNAAPAAAAASAVILPSGPENTPPLYSQRPPSPSPLVDLDDVRKFVGNAIIVWRKVRALGLRESSWENKMPWRQPRPRYLAKGLQRPPEEFSSETEKHEYYRRARRRGRYLIGPTPTWSFIVADLALLYFLIDNPAGKFLL
ncbi:hypothetical protein Mapa_005796 [Marchantia paleacea]|nr:hypothetical protein Mapa_005796 [Marchantia paleacea]